MKLNHVTIDVSPHVGMCIILAFSFYYGIVVTFGRCKQITGIPVIFTSALEGRGRTAVLRQVVDTYEKWCSRLPTARLNRWLLKVCKVFGII